MKADKKITVHVPKELLIRAQQSTGLGITGTIRRGLQLVADSGAYEKLRGMRGKLKFSVNVARLRRDQK